MTKNERKKFDEWAVGTNYQAASGSNIDYLDEEDKVCSGILYEQFLWQLQQDGCNEDEILKLAAAMGVRGLI